MAPDLAAATVFGLGKLDGQVPADRTIGNRKSDMHALTGCVNLVARLARTPLENLVHVQVMQVELTIPETGQGFGFFVFCYLTVVALETKFVVLFSVLDIKIFWEVLVQAAKVITAVWVMASIAVPVLHRSVFMLLRRHIVAHFGMARVAKHRWWGRE